MSRRPYLVASDIQVETGPRVRLWMEARRLGADRDYYRPERRLRPERRSLTPANLWWRRWGRAVGMVLTFGGGIAFWAAVAWWWTR